MSLGTIFLLVALFLAAPFIISWFSALKEENAIDKKSLEAEKFLTTEKKLFEQYRRKEQFQKNLLAANPKVIFVENMRMEVFLTDKALCYFADEHKYYETFPLQFDTIQFKLLAHTETRTYQITKDKNIVGRAVVGGIVAGGAGAVVGAATGLSNNGKKTVNAQGAFYTGTYRFAIVPNHTHRRIIKPNYILIKKSIASKINFAKKMEKTFNASVNLRGPQYKLDWTGIHKKYLYWVNDSSYEAYEISEAIKDENFAEKLMQCLKECTHTK